MNVKTGLSVPEGYGISYEDAVEIVTESECDFIEVLFDGRARPETVESEIGPVIEDVDDIGFVAHLPFTVPVWSPFESQLEGQMRTHRACLDSAASLDADAAVVHPSSTAMGDAYDESDIIDGVVESLADLCAYGEQLGISVLVENIQSGPFTLGGLQQVVERTPAGLVIDTGHARVSGHDMDELTSFVTQHRDQIEHVHLNDTRGPRDEHLPLGAGTFKFNSFLSALGHNWDGRLCVETITGEAALLEWSLDKLEKCLSEV